MITGEENFLPVSLDEVAKIEDRVIHHHRVTRAPPTVIVCRS